MAFAMLASESEDLVLASAAVLDQLMSSYLGVGSMAPMSLVAFFHPAAWCRPFFGRSAVVKDFPAESSIASKIPWKAVSGDR